MDPNKDENQKPSPAPVSTAIGSKEEGRIAQIEDLLNHSGGPEAPVEVRQEIRKVVEVHSEQPQLTDQDLIAGLRPSGETIIPTLQPTGAVQLPDQKVVGTQASAKPWREANSWFAILSKKVEEVRKFILRKKQMTFSNP